MLHFAPESFMLLRKIFGPKQEDVTGDWKRLPNEQYHDFYSSPNHVIKSRTMRFARNVACMREQKNAHRLFVGKPKGKRPLGRLRHRWEDNIKMYLKYDGRMVTVYLWHSTESSGGLLQT